MKHTFMHCDYEIIIRIANDVDLNCVTRPGITLND